MDHSYDDSVFINCPFDTEYIPKLEAIVFAVYRCGFYPESALSEDNALSQLAKVILKWIDSTSLSFLNNIL